MFSITVSVKIKVSSDKAKALFFCSNLYRIPSAKVFTLLLFKKLRHLAEPSDLCQILGSLQKVREYSSQKTWSRWINIT